MLSQSNGMSPIWLVFSVLKPRIILLSFVVLNVACLDVIILLKFKVNHSIKGMYLLLVLHTLSLVEVQAVLFESLLLMQY